MAFNFEQGEILLINKPYTWTSFDVVGRLRSLIRTHLGIRKTKIGHAGTLDPLATGLLILCTGKFTKRIDEFQGLEKEYTGTFRFGSTTPSFDLETEEDKFFSIAGLTTEKIEGAAQELTGSYDQIPPSFSAKWVDGRRAYQFARKDIDIELKQRSIIVHHFELTRIALPEIDFRITCSKGTYIRAIARDMGQILNCGAHLTALCRTRIGQFHLRDAYKLEEIENLLRSDSVEHA